MSRFRILLLLALVATFLAVAPVAADGGGHVQLAHMGFTLPDFISPVDVGAHREAEFRCVPPDECMVLADYFAAGTFFPYAAYSSDAYVSAFKEELLDRGIATMSTGRFNAYYTGPRLSGDRMRMFVTDGVTDLALDMYLTYSPDGSTRVIMYARPAAWTTSADGNGQPIFERMLDSLTINR